MSQLWPVAEAAQAAAARVRRGEGPSLLEAVTYRFKGHYGGDPEHTYRTREEIEEADEADGTPTPAPHLPTR